MNRLALALNVAFAMAVCAPVVVLTGCEDETQPPPAYPPPPAPADTAPAPTTAASAAAQSEEIQIGVDEQQGYADTDPSAMTEFKPTLEGHGAWREDSTYGTV